MSSDEHPPVSIWVWLAIPIFAVVVAWAFWVQPDDPTEDPHEQTAARARAEMAAIAEAIDAYPAPPEVGGRGVFVVLTREGKVPVQDPWGQHYDVRNTDPWTGFEVVSQGQPGGEEIVVRPARPNRDAAIVRSMNNMRQILTLMLSQVAAKGWRVFPYSGKCFVLGVVAQGLVDSRDPEALAILFSPGDPFRSVDRVEAGRFENVTEKGLRRGDEDLSELTSYAGRRNADREYRLTVARVAEGAPVIADISFQGVILIGYADGRVERHSYADFDLELPEDPFSPEPILADHAIHEDLLVLWDE